MRMQEIIEGELYRLGGALRTVETGSIRSADPRYEAGDGWSTLTFARYAQEHGGPFVSVDLNTSAASQVLEREGLRGSVDLREGNSLAVLPEVVEEYRTGLDVVLLDSENDADLIMEEFSIVRHAMFPGSVLLVDDVVPGSRTVVKGRKLLPFLESSGYTTEIIKRDGGGFTSGVLKVIM
jgi:predicted O-methyltransferase YrrM